MIANHIELIVNASVSAVGTVYIGVGISGLSAGDCVRASPFVR